MTYWDEICYQLIRTRNNYILFEIVSCENGNKSLLLELLGKRVQRYRSLPTVALRSFLKGTQVSQNTTRYE